MGRSYGTLPFLLLSCICGSGGTLDFQRVWRESISVPGGSDGGRIGGVRGVGGFLLQLGLVINNKRKSLRLNLVK